MNERNNRDIARELRARARSMRENVASTLKDADKLDAAADLIAPRPGRPPGRKKAAG